MGIITNSDRSEVNESAYVSGIVTATTSQLEAKAAASRLSNRQEIMLYNDGTNLVYFGPTGVTASGATKGIPLNSKDTITITIGDIGLFLITASGTSVVVVQEFS